MVIRLAGVGLTSSLQSLIWPSGQAVSGRAQSHWQTDNSEEKGLPLRPPLARPASAESLRVAQYKVPRETAARRRTQRRKRATQCHRTNLLSDESPRGRLISLEKLQYY